MSEHRELLIDAVERMLSEQSTPEVVAAAEHEWPAALWDVIEEAGLPLAPVPEEAGGGGATLADALAVAGQAARHAAPLPLPETGILAGRLLADAGLEVPPGPLAAAWDETLSIASDGTLTGTAVAVPWGRRAHRLVVLAGGQVAVGDPAAATIHQETNIAGDWRDDLVLDGVTAEAHAPSTATAANLDVLAALLRATQIAGGLQAILDLSVRYSTEREQFGRPISKFQAIQHMLAELAAEVVAANSAVDLATGAYTEDVAGAELVVAVAKVRAGQAATKGSELAHQVHGAIGFTDEHQLHLFTRRVLAWRDEHGSEAHWAGVLGHAALAGPGGAWALVTSVP
jgi:acyl-CoA dehydrogenase